jgi:aminoglycoside phosphotransferase (APT) family kinase protein
MLPALNPKVVDGHQVFLAQPLLHNVGARVEGTEIARQGVLMKASTLRGTPVYWLQGSTENYVLRRPDGDLVQSDAEAITRARELIAKGKATQLRELDTKHLEPPLPSGQRKVDGVVFSNTQVVQRYVGARVAGTNQALQGAVMKGNGPEGTPVYWLQGKKDYVLRNPDGSPVSSPKQAVDRARQLIANGAATSLHPLDLKVVNDPRPLSRSNVLFIDGVRIVGGKVRAGSVGGRDPDGKPGQGDLMWGRTGEGNVVFWLQGRQTNYLLRSPTTNDPIRSQPEAEARARELISNGAARDLRPLELAPQRSLSR